MCRYSYVCCVIYFLYLLLYIFSIFVLLFLGLSFWFMYLYITFYLPLFFFFKQKTAYEMRISDWSSDVCSSDLKTLMGTPDIASRRWIWEQYDSQVGADTVQTGGDAALVRIHGTNRALAMSTDCTPRYCYADPVEGGKQAVAETWRNISAVGATPLAITNCLNFANPQRPEIMGQIVGCLDGMAQACRTLDYPIVSGNVSLYNESKATGGGSAILPTPAIGGVGRSEEHTSELQSLMRTSYAAFCLNKKQSLNPTSIAVT